MIDTNTTPDAEAVERVAKALWEYDSRFDVRETWAWDEAVARDVSAITLYRERAVAAIQTHTAWLWERAMQPDVIDAVGEVIYGNVDSSYKCCGYGHDLDEQIADAVTEEATEAVTAALTALLGPRPEGDTNAD